MLTYAGAHSIQGTQPAIHSADEARVRGTVSALEPGTQLACFTGTKVQILTPEEPQGILSALEPHHEFAPLAPLKQASKRTSRRAVPEGPVGGVVLREEADEEVC